MKFVSAIIALFLLLSFTCAAEDAKPANTNMNSTVPSIPAGDESIILGAGCFWCTEAVFQQIPGVVSVTSGYIGGTVKHPTYEQICTGTTGHAEASRIVYDPKKTDLEKILAVFWEAHDPTSLNRQGADSGTQYRSAIFYNTDEQRKIAEKSKTEAAKEFSKPIVTEITKAGEFYPAEDYHQDYYRLNKNKNPYCRMVISPKLKKLGLKE
ncbi:MAG TPA: peptide-methionine (S)-S-oxide reductase MsrA [Verrucomicrobiae bacterium]|nr:peptide-methionine (S)-S-oxide reductase MsrA [Verrucomicrobiae bacterium]